MNQSLSLRSDYYIIGIPRSIWSIAISDMLMGIKNYPLWMFLGWQDIRQRYRRSILGPFWLTLSTCILVTMMSLLYGRLFRLPLEVYTPFLASGTIIWGFISTLLNEGCSSFMAADSLIKQVRLPLTLHVCRVIWRNILVFLHNIVILLPVWLLFHMPITLLGLLSATLGAVVIAINGLWVGLILGALCARFRDIMPIINNLVQVVFFITPIMWLPSILQGKGIAGWLILFNPFYHFIEIIRAPLLGTPFPTSSWLVVLAITGAGLLCSTLLLGHFKNRVAYWL